MASSMHLDRDLSPSEFVKLHCFPLQDYELVKVYETHIQIIDNLRIIYSRYDKSEDIISKMDSNELRKISKIAAEFSARFSRNYIYPLQLNLSKLNRLITSGKAMDPKSSETLKKILTNVYQMALQAVAAYSAYVTPLGRLHATEKLSILLHTLIDIHNICRNLLIPVMESVGHGTEEIMPEMCYELLDKMVINTQKKKKITFIKEKKVKTPKPVEGDLVSVYGGKLETWKLKAATLEKLKQDREKRKVQREKLEPASDTVATQNVGRNIQENRLVVRRREVVCAEGDVDTEIERYTLHEAKTKEDLREKKPAPNITLRKTLLEALKLVDLGDEATALAKLKDMPVTKESSQIQQTPSNVQFLTIRSVSMDEEVVDKEEQHLKRVSTEARNSFPESKRNEGKLYETHAETARSSVLSQHDKGEIERETDDTEDIQITSSRRHKVTTKRTSRRTSRPEALRHGTDEESHKGRVKTARRPQTARGRVRSPEKVCGSKQQLSTRQSQEVELKVSEPKEFSRRHREDVNHPEEGFLREQPNIQQRPEESTFRITEGPQNSARFQDMDIKELVRTATGKSKETTKEWKTSSEVTEYASESESEIEEQLDNGDESESEIEDNVVRGPQGRQSSIHYRRQKATKQPLRQLRVCKKLVTKWTPARKSMDKVVKQQANIVGSVADHLVDDLVEEIITELVDDKFLRHIYQYELDAV